MDKTKLDQIVKQAITRYPDAKDSIKLMADKVIKSGNTKAIKLYAEELERQITSKDADVIKHIKRGNKHYDQWSNTLSEGFGSKFWSYLMPRILRLIVIVAIVICIFFFIKK